MYHGYSTVGCIDECHIVKRALNSLNDGLILVGPILSLSDIVRQVVKLPGRGTLI
jgi:hypothetical protein